LHLQGLQIQVLQGSWVLLVVLFLWVAGCGKNAPVNIGNAPYPISYYGGNTSDYPNFYPQMPQGYPNQYTPFLPIDNFMRSSPSCQSCQNYWTTFMSGWQNYAQYNGISPYNFSYFWTSYCPQQWQGSSMMGLHQYFNQSFYYWVTPSTQFNSSITPNSFWGGYSGYSYGGLHEYGY
jgi:hypothetical protein